MSLARTIGRNTAFAIAARMSTMTAWFLVAPLLLSVFGAERFGYWSILLAFGGMVATVDLGLGIAVSRYTAEQIGRGRPGNVRHVLSRAALVQGAFALALAALALVAREPMLDLVRVGADWRDEARDAYAIAVAGFVVGVPLGLLTATLSGMQRMDLYALVQVPGALALLAAVAAAGGAARPLVAVTAAQGLVLALLVAGSAWAVRRALREAAGSGAIVPAAAEDAPAAPAMKDLIRFSAWIQANSILALVHQQVDKFLLAAFVALGPVASYELGTRVSVVALLVPVLGLGALLPAMVERSGAGFSRVESSLLDLYRGALGPYLAIVVGVVAAVLVLAPAVLQAWLGTATPEDVFTLRCLVLAGGVSASTGVASTLVRAVGAPWLETQYGVMTVACHLVFSVVGGAAWGWPGILAGLVLSTSIASPVFIGRVEGRLGLAPLVGTGRALRGPLGSALGAAVAGSLALLLLRGAPAGRAGGLVALAAGAASFGLVYVLALRRLAPETTDRLQATLQATLQRVLARGAA